MEKQPGFRLSISGGGEFDATPDNSVLFRFIGKLAVYDHAFFVTNAEENRGMYLFNVNEMFDEVADFMMINDYPMHLNLREVAQCDMDAFDRMVNEDASHDLEDGIPEGWS